MNIFEPAPTGFARQAEFLQSRGLSIDNYPEALGRLRHIGYYHLQPYMIPFRERIDGQIQLSYRKGTTFRQVFRLYCFDRKLRLLLFDMIERIEISLRSILTDQMTTKYGEHWLGNKTLFKIRRVKLKGGGHKVIDIWSDLQRHTQEQQTKGLRPNAPAPEVLETAYFSHLTLLCEGLKHNSDLNNIAQAYSLHPKAFVSWMKALNQVRNICAHHSRLWNTTVKATPYFPHDMTTPWIKNIEQNHLNSMYYVFCLSTFLAHQLGSGQRFRQDLLRLCYQTIRR